MPPPNAQVALWAALGGLLLLAGYRLARWVERLAQRRRTRRAAAGERRAAPLLRAHGYRVVSGQTPGSWVVHVDGQPLEVDLRADYLVERAGRRYVAEVKTGRRAPDPRSAETRRQLLEYRLAYDVHGVLLVDMERQRIRRVDFPLTRRRSPLAWLCIGGALGALCARTLLS